MKSLGVLIVCLTLSSCATNAYNPSFIMGDQKKIEIKQEPVAHLNQGDSYK